MSTRATLALVWGGVLTSFLGIWVGTYSRKAELPVSGGTVTCGSAWSPNDIGRLYPGVGRACDAAIGNAGVLALILTIVGVLVVLAVLVTVAASRPAVGTPDHP